MSLVNYSLKYAESGLLVFPLKPTKQPYVSQHNATTDPVQIKKWWSEYPDAIIGCRIPQDELVLDIDPRHGGDKTWRGLNLTRTVRFRRAPPPERPGRWWDACLVTRPDGKLSESGLNVWAREHGTGEQPHGPDGTPLPRWTGGIDILRYEHRYSILPPSPHPETGKSYVWLREGEVAETPSWLADLLRAPTRPERGPCTWAPEVLGQEIASPAEWFCANRNWADILGPAEWYVVGGGDGE